MSLDLLYFRQWSPREVEKTLQCESDVLVTKAALRIGLEQYRDSCGRIYGARGKCESIM